MNLKQAKMIRKGMRGFGVDWRAADYTKIRGVVTLCTGCGKAAYRRAKRSFHDPL